MNNKSFEELKELVLDWSDDKDLLHSENADKQFMKFIEEVFEFKFELENYKNYQKDWEHIKMPGAFFLEKVKDEMGDIFVTLIILCKQICIDPVECLDMAYEKISKRHGRTINGTFVKSEDLDQ